MWLPILLKSLNEADMQSKGCKLSSDDIYNVNKTSLKMALCIFNGGCTGEIISKEGLLITNHHCGYSQIQQHSRVEKDYLTAGFWAKTKEEELPESRIVCYLYYKHEGYLPMKFRVQWKSINRIIA